MSDVTTALSTGDWQGLNRIAATAEIRNLPLKEYLEVPFYLPSSLREAVCDATAASKRTPAYRDAYDRLNNYYKAHNSARKFLQEVEVMVVHKIREDGLKWDERSVLLNPKLFKPEQPAN